MSGLEVKGGYVNNDFPTPPAPFSMHSFRTLLCTGLGWLSTKSSTRNAPESTSDTPVIPKPVDDRLPTVGTARDTYPKDTTRSESAPDQGGCTPVQGLADR